MSLHRLAIEGSAKKQREVDTLVIRRYLRGEAPLKEALALDAQTIASLRAHAKALYEAGKWHACIDVILGLASIGEIDPFDPMILAGAYAELGDHESAALCAEAAEAMLSELGRILDDLDPTKERGE